MWPHPLRDLQATAATATEKSLYIHSPASLYRVTFGTPLFKRFQLFDICMLNKNYPGQEIPKYVFGTGSFNERD